MARGLSVALLLCGLAAPAAAAEIVLPPGFASQVYVSGEGFDRGGDARGLGIPVVLTLGVDPAGVLYLAKSGNRYGSGQTEELLTRLYRIPPGGVRLTPATEGAYLHGPPLRNPEVGAVSAGVLFVTTYDPDREVGVLYRMTDGRPVLLAGGTPPAGRPALLKQPEGVAVDGAGNLYVADRARGVVVKLDPTGRPLDLQYAKVPRARTLAVDGAGHLWVGGDGTAAQPWQEGVGQIWRLGSEGSGKSVFDGPHAAAIAAGPTGHLFVAQRHTRTLFVLTPEGQRIEFATLAGEAMPRGLAFAPDTPETRRAGIAGDLFVVSFTLRTWYLNDVIRISGPFAEFVRRAGVTE